MGLIGVKMNPLPLESLWSNYNVVIEAETKSSSQLVASEAGHRAVRGRARLSGAWLCHGVDLRTGNVNWRSTSTEKTRRKNAEAGTSVGDALPWSEPGTGHYGASLLRAGEMIEGLSFGRYAKREFYDVDPPQAGYRNATTPVRSSHEAICPETVLRRSARMPWRRLC